MEQIKSIVSVRLKVVINLNNYKREIARLHNIAPENVDVVVVEGEDAPKVETPKVEEEPLGGPVVGKKNPEPKKRSWLMEFLTEQKLMRKEAAQLCGVNRSTIDRACVGQRLRMESYEAIVKGLGLNPEQQKAFKKSLKSKQRDYHGRECKKVE